MWVQACMVNIPFFISILYLYVWPFARRNDVHLHESTRLSGVHEALESALKVATGVQLMWDTLGKRFSYWQHQTPYQH